MKFAYIISLFFFLAASFSVAQTPSVTRASTTPIKDCTDKERYESLDDCFALQSEADLGFKMIHKDSHGNEIKTPYVAMLVHGLSDSPYFYRDLSQVIFSEGINVFAIRSSNHGTHYSHLRQAKREDWYEDIRWGKKRAQQYGEKLILGGMSMGGALIVHNALKDGEDVDGMLLFSPAISLPWFFRLICLYEPGYIGTKTYGKGVRYPSISNAGVCELHKINQEILSHKLFPGNTSRLRRAANRPHLNNNQLRRKNRKALFPSLDFPVFNVLSVYDNAISLETAYEFSRDVASASKNQSKVVLFTKAGDKDRNGNKLNQQLFPSDTVMIESEYLAHASVLLKPSDHDLTPETNPHFDLLANELRTFLNTQFKPAN